MDWISGIIMLIVGTLLFPEALRSDVWPGILMLFASLVMVIGGIALIAEKGKK